MSACALVVDEKRERERVVRVAFGLGFDKKECKINGRSWVCAALMFME